MSSGFVFGSFQFLNEIINISNYLLKCIQNNYNRNTYSSEIVRSIQIDHEKSIAYTLT